MIGTLETALSFESPRTVALPLGSTTRKETSGSLSDSPVLRKNYRLDLKGAEFFSILGGRRPTTEDRMYHEDLAGLVEHSGRPGPLCGPLFTTEDLARG